MSQYLLNSVYAKDIQRCIVPYLAVIVVVFVSIYSGAVYVCVRVCSIVLFNCLSYYQIFFNRCYISNFYLSGVRGICAIYAIYSFQ